MFPLRKYIRINSIKTVSSPFYSIHRGKHKCQSEFTSFMQIRSISKTKVIFPNLLFKHNPKTLKATRKHQDVLNYQNNGNIFPFLDLHRPFTGLQSNRKNEPHRKKKSICIETQNAYQIAAYATADSYNIELMTRYFARQGFTTGISDSLFDDIPSARDLNKQMKSGEILRVEAPEKRSGESQDIYIFKEGMIVFWNFNKQEQTKLLIDITNFENNSYSRDVISYELETLYYSRDNSKANKLEPQKNMITIGESGSCYMEKFTISHALAMSAKLGILESHQSDYIDQISQYKQIYSNEKVVLSSDEVHELIGDLCNITHYYNRLQFSVPDFCWENENLENLYYDVLRFLDIRKRSVLLLDRLKSCLHMMEQLRSYYNVSRSYRLEALIVALIVVEILVEFLRHKKE